MQHQRDNKRPSNCSQRDSGSYLKPQPNLSLESIDIYTQQFVHKYMLLCIKTWVDFLKLGLLSRSFNPIELQSLIDRMMNDT